MWNCHSSPLTVSATSRMPAESGCEIDTILMRNERLWRGTRGEKRSVGWRAAAGPRRVESYPASEYSSSSCPTFIGLR